MPGNSTSFSNAEIPNLTHHLLLVTTPMSPLSIAPTPSTKWTRVGSCSDKNSFASGEETAFRKSPQGYVFMQRMGGMGKGSYFLLASLSSSFLKHRNIPLKTLLMSSLDSRRGKTVMTMAAPNPQAMATRTQKAK